MPSSNINTIIVPRPITTSLLQANTNTDRVLPRNFGKMTF